MCNNLWSVDLALTIVSCGYSHCLPFCSSIYSSNCFSIAIMAAGQKQTSAFALVVCFISSTWKQFPLFLLLLFNTHVSATFMANCCSFLSSIHSCNQPAYTCTTLSMLRSWKSRASHFAQPCISLTNVGLTLIWQGRHTFTHGISWKKGEMSEKWINKIEKEKKKESLLGWNYVFEYI